jgi:transposase InsO family protein
MEEIGFLDGYKRLIQDRDGKFCPGFRELIASHGIENVRLPARSPNLNAFAERWVRSVKEECLSFEDAVQEHRCKERLGGRLKYYCRKAA